MACPARGEGTNQALKDEPVTNVLAKLAVPWLLPCLVNETPIAMVASILHFIAHFLNLVLLCYLRVSISILISKLNGETGPGRGRLLQKPSHLQI